MLFSLTAGLGMTALKHKHPRENGVQFPIQSQLLKISQLFTHGSSERFFIWIVIHITHQKCIGTKKTITKQYEQRVIHTSISTYLWYQYMKAIEFERT